MNEQKIILTKKQKIILLQILKSGEMTRQQSFEIISPFEPQMTLEELKAFLIELKAEI